MVISFPCRIPPCVPFNEECMEAIGTLFFKCSVSLDFDEAPVNLRHIDANLDLETSAAMPFTKVLSPLTLWWCGIIGAY